LPIVDLIRFTIEKIPKFAPYMQIACKAPKLKTTTHIVTTVPTITYNNLP
jgi:hypothetical protein